MKKLVIILCSMLALSACSTAVEMPYEPEGTDVMRQSPCACLPIDFQQQNFEWSNEVVS